MKLHFKPHFAKQKFQKGKKGTTRRGLWENEYLCSHQRSRLPDFSSFSIISSSSLALLWGLEVLLHATLEMFRVSFSFHSTFHFIQSSLLFRASPCVHSFLCDYEHSMDVWKSKKIEILFLGSFCYRKKRKTFISCRHV